MREEELKALFAEYRESLGTCDRRSFRRRGEARQLAIARLAGAGLAGAGLLAVGSIAFWPTDAAAHALRKMGTAIRYARSMDVAFDSLRPSGKWVTFSRFRFRDGMSRIDDLRSAGLACTVITRDGSEWTDFHRLDHVSRSPGRKLDWGEMGGENAVDDAMRSIDSGHTDVRRSVRLRSHAPISGVPTYDIVLDRAKDRYHAEILVDARTDLPISTECSVDYGPEHGGLNRFRQTYRFNEPLVPSLFVPEKDKPVVDLRSERLHLMERWQTPLATVDGSDVLDASLTSDGTVWLVVGRKSFDGRIALPTTIAGHARLREFAPTHFDDRAEPFTVEERDVVVCGFPRVDGISTNDVSVGFARREGNLPQMRLPEDRTAEFIDNVRLRLRSEPGTVPSYFTALDMDRFALEVPVQVWDVRASALEALGRDLDAAHAFEKEAEADASFIRYVGYRPLQRAALCYDRLGLKEKAADARRRASALKTERER